jgi:hypothetical protein
MDYMFPNLFTKLISGYRSESSERHGMKNEESLYQLSSAAV